MFSVPKIKVIILIFEFVRLDLFFTLSASASVRQCLKYSSFSSLKCVTVVYAPLPLTDVSQHHTFSRGRAPTFRCFSTFGLHIVQPHNSWSARFTTFIKNCQRPSLLVALKRLQMPYFVSSVVSVVLHCIVLIAVTNLFLHKR